LNLGYLLFALAHLWKVKARLDLYSVKKVSIPNLYAKSFFRN